MRQASKRIPDSAEKTVRHIRRNTRRRSAADIDDDVQIGCLAAHQPASRERRAGTNEYNSHARAPGKEPTARVRPKHEITASSRRPQPPD
jgi:hypothetical protein